MEYIRKGTDAWHQLWELRDTRVDHLPLMGGLVPVFLICGFYIYLVKVWGPRYMQERKPYDLRYIEVCFYVFVRYNFLSRDHYLFKSFPHFLQCNPDDSQHMALCSSMIYKYITAQPIHLKYYVCILQFSWYWLLKYDWQCQPIDYSDTDDANYVGVKNM